jgi:DNA-binding PadR family transcriptional regulator
MSLDHAILGFLSSRALSGYDLKKIFDTSVRHFWPADQSQIYRTLRRLVQQGWAEQEVVEQAARPDRKVYRLTPAGRVELERWLATELPASPARSPEMIQVFFAAQLSDDHALALFERAAAQIRRGLAVYDAIPHALSDYRDYTHSPRTFYFWMLTLEIGKMQLQANLDWIEHTIQRIRDGEVPPP